MAFCIKALDIVLKKSAATAINVSPKLSPFDIASTRALPIFCAKLSDADISLPFN